MMPTFVLTLQFIGTWRHASFYVTKGSAFQISINLRKEVILTELQEFGTTKKLLWQVRSVGWATNTRSRSVNQEISRPRWNSQVQYHNHNSSALNSILDQNKPL